MKNTKSGSYLESTVSTALNCGGYSTARQQLVGKRLGGGKHYIDIIASDNKVSFLVSLKWQQVPGTAEDKVPFEVICLQEAVQKNTGKFLKAYLVLGGEGWKRRQFFCHDLIPFLKDAHSVEIVTMEAFIGRANSGAL